MPIAKPVTSLGRGDENDIVIRGPGVSRNHAEVSISGTGVILRDLGSTNGTHVNGVDVSGTRHLLRHWDEIRLGSSEDAGNRPGCSRHGPSNWGDPEGRPAARAHTELPGIPH
jgi:putative peptide zinc metalloprotease protein